MAQKMQLFCDKLAMLMCFGDNLPFCRSHGLNVYIKNPSKQAEACVIWMHGLGADAQDMMGLASQLPMIVPVRHVFMDAPIRPVTLNQQMPMRAWYDIVGLALTDREDREGILASEQMIRQVIEQQLAEGFSSQQIFLAGFSQGGAMALWTGLQCDLPLAGVVALSAYLPMSSTLQVALSKTTPIFMACGQQDPLVLPVWTKQSMDYLRHHGFQSISWHEYSMAHAICMQEIRDLADWFADRIHAFAHSTGESS